MLNVHNVTQECPTLMRSAFARYPYATSRVPLVTPAIRPKLSNTNVLVIVFVVARNRLNDDLIFAVDRW